jgi:competence protein ComFC
MISLDSLLSLIAPASCVGCQKDGLPLCNQCYVKFSESYKSIGRCILCNKKTAGDLCRICNRQTGIDKVFSLGEHNGLLKKLIWDLKFNSSKANISCLASYLKCELKEFENSRAVLIPAPTAPKRARSRGYDQAKLLAKNLVKLNANWAYKDLLIRNNDSDQIGLSKLDRKQRTKNLFLLNPSAELKSEYDIAILIDDVITTGSTIKAAVEAIAPLKFKHVVLACLSHKPLEP